MTRRTAEVQQQMLSILLTTLGSSGLYSGTVHHDLFLQKSRAFVNNDLRVQSSWLLGVGLDVDD